MNVSHQKVEPRASNKNDNGKLVPPLQPNSPRDISSFTALDLALRSHPELAREGASILNAKALARLVDGIRKFQDIHLGKDSKLAKKKLWPFVRMPDQIFRDRSRSGPLFTAILSAYRQKKDSSWRHFDFISPKRYEDNISLLDRMEKDLIATGHLNRPVIYFDTSVGEHKEEYQQIVERFGGKVTNDPNGSSGTRPTHIVAWDPEEHDSEDSMMTEDTNEDLAKLYLRTITVIDSVGKREQGGIVESNMAASKKKGGKIKDTVPTHEHPMALVHWWYWPSSFDEWMAASDVAGDADNQPLILTRNSGEPWVVSCKFIRDVAKFNEWGVEADYVITQYEKKVDYYIKLAVRTEKQEESKCGRKSKLNIFDRKNSHIRKVQRLDTVSFSSDSLSKPNLSIIDKKDKNFCYVNSRQIPTGFFKPNGKQILHPVFDRALKVPPLASSLMQGALQELEFDVLNNGLVHKVNKKPDLSILRPSENPVLASNFTITELRSTSTGGTVSSNFNRNICISPEQATVRIRGGGFHESLSMKDNETNAQTKSEVRNKSHGMQEDKKEATVNSSQSQELDNTPKSFSLEIMKNHNGDNETDHKKSMSNIETLREKNNSHLIMSEKEIEPLKNVGKVMIGIAKKLNNPITFSKDATKAISSVPYSLDSVVKKQGIEGIPPSSIKRKFNDISITHPQLHEGSFSTFEENNLTASKHSKTASDTKTKLIKKRILNEEQVKVIQLNSSFSTKAIEILHNKQQEFSNNTIKEEQDMVVPESTSAIPINALESKHVELTLLPIRSERPTIINGTNTHPGLHKIALPSSKDDKISSANSKISEAVVIKDKLLISQSLPPLISSPIGAQSKVLEKKDYQIFPMKKQSNCLPVKIQGSIPMKQQSSNTTPEQETTIQRPSWYVFNSVSEFERSMLPEWFNSSSEHRTALSYLAAREKIIQVAQRTGKYITATVVRRIVPGDAGSLLRLHQFLMTWGFINGSAIGESAPNTMNHLINTCEEHESIIRPESVWSEEQRNTLTNAVIRHSLKQSKEISQNEENSTFINWDAVSSEVGCGFSPVDCQCEFLSIPFDEIDVSGAKLFPASDNIKNYDSATSDRLTIKNRKNMNKDLSQDILNGVPSDVIIAATNAALKASNGHLAHAQKGALLGIISSQALFKESKEENLSSQILLEILNQRMKKLENRLSIMDDIEGMLDAERIALEIERRDLYTSRCCQWLSDGSLK